MFNFLYRFPLPKKLKNQNFMKIPLVRNHLFNTDGQSGMTKLIFAFCNFVKAPKNPKGDYGSFHKRRIHKFSHHMPPLFL